MKLISFNSYKGGACRTTTCYNILPYLAKKLGATAHQPIIVFDIDLDSMGMTSILNPKHTDIKTPLTYSARNLFVDDTENINGKIREGRLSSVEDEWYFKYFQRVGRDLGLEDEGSVLFCGADINASTISDDDYDRYKESSPLQDLIGAFEDLAEEDQPKAIIFDCASGLQMSTIAALSFVHKAVVCMRPSLQFRIGTYDYLVNRIPKVIGRDCRHEIILLPTSVPSNIISDSDPNYEKAEKKLNELQISTKELISAGIIDAIQLEDESTLGYVLNDEMAESDDFGLPEVERFKWSELLLYKDKDAPLTERETLLQQKYEQLASILAKDF